MDLIQRDAQGLVIHSQGLECRPSGHSQFGESELVVITVLAHNQVSVAEHTRADAYQETWQCATVKKKAPRREIEPPRPFERGDLIMHTGYYMAVMTGLMVLSFDLGLLIGWAWISTQYSRIRLISILQLLVTQSSITIQIDQNGLDPLNRIHSGNSLTLSHNGRFGRCVGQFPWSSGSQHQSHVYTAYHNVIGTGIMAMCGKINHTAKIRRIISNAQHCVMGVHMLVTSGWVSQISALWCDVIQLYESVLYSADSPHCQAYLHLLYSG